MESANMKVLFITSTPFPKGMAATNRIRNYGTKHILTEFKDLTAHP
jgi:hypothetical protein